MLRYMSSILPLFLLLISFSLPALSQSTITKKINVTVTDAATGKPLEGAEVIFKGLLKKQTKTTDNAGRVLFEIPLLSSSLNATIEVNDGSFISGHSSFKTIITLKDNQEVYDVTVSLKSSYKGVSVAVVDEENRQGIPNAKVTLKGANDLRDMVNYTDGYGNASFEVLLIDNIKNVPVVIEKDGYTSYSSAFEMNRKSERYTVSAAGA